MKLCHYVIVFFVIVLSSCNSRLPYERDVRARAILEDVAVWFIEEGLSEYYKGKDLYFLEKSIEQREAYLYTDILIEKLGYLAQIIPQYMWVRSTVTCYARIKSNNIIYEYWVVDRFGGTRSDVDREIYFIITKSEGMDKKREIIQRRAKFFSEFNTPEGDIVQFPIDDNKSIYELRSWYYPEAFMGTELEGVKVVIENKEYVKKKIIL